MEFLDKQDKFMKMTSILCSNCGCRGDAKKCCHTFISRDACSLCHGPPGSPFCRHNFNIKPKVIRSTPYISWTIGNIITIVRDAWTNGLALSQREGEANIKKSLKDDDIQCSVKNTRRDTNDKQYLKVRLNTLKSLNEQELSCALYFLGVQRETVPRMSNYCVRKFINDKGCIDKITLLEVYEMFVPSSMTINQHLSIQDANTSQWLAFDVPDWFTLSDVENKKIK